MTNRTPDLQNAAQAWHVEITEAAAEAHRREFGYDHTGIDQWVIHGPYHPHWSWWYVAAISLADVPGVPPANKQFPGAEHEISFWSLDGTPNVEALENGDAENHGFTFLHPADVTFQFEGLTAQQVASLTNAAVRLITDGQSCDSDLRSSAGCLPHRPLHAGRTTSAPRGVPMGRTASAVLPIPSASGLEKISEAPLRIRVAAGRERN